MKRVKKRENGMNNKKIKKKKSSFFQSLIPVTKQKTTLKIVYFIIIQDKINRS
jgi:hypothetical protein